MTRRALPMNAGRREVLVLGAAALLGIPASRAQPLPKRVLWLGVRTMAKKVHGRIRMAFADQGLVEGRDFTVTYESIRDSSASSVEAHVDELVGRSPDVIVVVAHWCLSYLRKRTTRIPVVFYNLGSDPVTLGMVESLARPGANFTGTTLRGDEWMTKKWQLLKDIRPSMKVGGDLWLRDDTPAQAALRATSEMQAELKRHRAVRGEIEARLGIRIREIEIPGAFGREELAEAMKKHRAEGIVTFYRLKDAQVDALNTSRIPACGALGDVRKGLLLGLGWDWLEGESQAVRMAARILRGESPATMPIYQHDRFSVGVNLATARAMGIGIPGSVLVQATEVIE